METTLAPRHGYDMETIRFSGLRGKNLRNWLLLPLRLLLALWQSASVIRKVRPDVVSGHGRISRLSGGNDGVIFGEAIADTRTELDSRARQQDLDEGRGQSVAGFSGVIRSGAKVIFTGNPVRQRNQSIASPERRYASCSGRLKLLVIGGSLGAQALNTILPLALNRIPEASRPSVTASGWNASPGSAQKELCGSRRGRRTGYIHRQYGGAICRMRPCESAGQARSPLPRSAPPGVAVSWCRSLTL